MNFIAKKVIELDVETGLDKEIRIVSITIDALVKTISITYCIVLVSPTGVAMKTLEENTVTRTNLECNPKWDQLEASSIGQGIKQMLQPDLNAYPNMLQANNC